ncbi:MAG: SGNH/GDSL hydrolase family protein [Anaerolineales bacterium]
MKFLLRIAYCVLLTACATATPLSTVVPASPTSTFIAPPATQPATEQLPITNPQLPTESLQSPASNSPTLNWKDMPVIPTDIDTSLRKVYERGLQLGNDPRAFSLFGDCQARPAEFFGVFETDETLFASLSPDLQEIVDNFRGSFNRESPTAQDGTTPGALLWIQWHQGKYDCTFAETPVECELRIHRPSFVIIQIGTHFERRNTEYLRKIIEQLIDAGVVPILATKADNREKDERINRDMALLASEYDLPLWNFWAALSDLPNRGLYTRDDRPLQGDIYLTDEAAQIHRMTGLEALNAVWRAVTDK